MGAFRPISPRADSTGVDGTAPEDACGCAPASPKPIVGPVRSDEGRFEVTAPAKVFLYLELAPASRISGLTIGADSPVPPLN
jgi:hypothetical protein